MILEVQVLPEWVKKAKRKSNEMGVLHHSITKGDGNVAGFVGEIVVHEIIGGIHKPTYQYDIIKDNIKYDVKTKRCTSPPLPEYECSIASFNPNQDCDYYIFTRVLENYKYCWVLGYMAKKDYFDNARFCKRGQIDEKSNLGWTFKADCYNVEITKLKDINDLRS